MKTFLGFALPALCAVVFALPAAAQHGGRSSALGGRLAPSGAMNRPLGGFPTPSPGIGVNRGFGGAGLRRGIYPYAYSPYGYSPYAYSYYVPGYFDDLDSGSYYNPYYGYGAAAPPAVPAYVPSPAAAPQQPVIINQYFGVQGPQPQPNGPEPGGNQPQAAGGVIGRSAELLPDRVQEPRGLLRRWHIGSRTRRCITSRRRIRTIRLRST